MQDIIFMQVSRPNAISSMMPLGVVVDGLFDQIAK